MDELKDILVRAGQDPVMIQVQDRYFDEQYWLPAVKFCDAMGFITALALAVTYDSTIHGSLYRIHKRLPPNLSEKSWINHYVAARRNWFINHPNQLLRRCTYRMDTFQKLIEAGNYDLHSPVFAHGRRADINIVDREQPSPVPPVAPEVETSVPINTNTQRVLDMGDRGQDVFELQQSLLKIGYKSIGIADSHFGRKTELAVMALQKVYGLVADGIVGPSTWRLIDQLD